ncbi:MAG: hypothetical protein ACI4LK_02370 [Lentihominibacter sp.]
MNDRDKEFINGYDWCVNNCIELFFSNLDIYQISNNGFDLIGYLESNEEVKEEFEEALLDYTEMHRNQLITSMLDGYEE